MLDSFGKIAGVEKTQEALSNLFELVQHRKVNRIVMLALVTDLCDLKCNQ
jgi:hypothetical protein